MDSEKILGCLVRVCDMCQILDPFSFFNNTQKIGLRPLAGKRAEEESYERITLRIVFLCPSRVSPEAARSS